MTECIAFEGNRRIAIGTLAEVARKTKHLIDRESGSSILIFDASSSRQIELDFRGSIDDVIKRITQPTAPVEENRKGPGRPKLGVVPREVTLLPRHWDWLATQPGGASVTLRKLVEEARKKNAEKDRKREEQEATYRFISVMAGNEPGYEEALRALYADKRDDFDRHTNPWPKDIKSHARHLAHKAMSETMDTEKTGLAL
jgi:hypothetical protein